MRYSYAWELSVGDLSSARRRGALSLQDYYVRVEGQHKAAPDVLLYDPTDTGQFVGVYRNGHFVRADLERPTYYGRVFTLGDETILDVAHVVGIDVGTSRFTGASIAGLVVGAMGVFVFTVALRHWLGERRRFRGEAPGHFRTSPTSQ
jgi:hypothetical protein